MCDTKKLLILGFRRPFFLKLFCFQGVNPMLESHKPLRVSAKPTFIQTNILSKLRSFFKMWTKSVWKRKHFRCHITICVIHHTTHLCVAFVIQACKACKRHANSFLRLHASCMLCMLVACLNDKSYAKMSIL